MTIRILLVDDHKVVRKGLHMFLVLDEELEIVGEAANGIEAVRAARSLRPDVVLMDILMPEMDGLTATRMIRQELPEVEVIALTSVLEGTTIQEALRAGAIGYLLKDTDSNEMCRAIRAAAAGQVQLSPQAAQSLMKDLSVFQPPETLTDREIEVLKLLAHGFSNRGIADALGIGEKTVKTHVSNILAKLGLLSRTQAALYALQAGLTSLADIDLNP
jgi:two-component system, NarL family, response regulator LiaR